MPTRFLKLSSTLCALAVAVGCSSERPSEAPEPDAGSTTGAGLVLSDGCWTLDYGPSTAGLPASDAPDLPPEQLRIWTDSTFPNAEGLLQVAAAPGFEGSGGGMLTQVSAEPDSIELTWTAGTTSTHLRLAVTPGSMTGTAWHHGESGTDGSEPRAVQLNPVACTGSR